MEFGSFKKRTANPCRFSQSGLYKPFHCQDAGFRVQGKIRLLPMAEIRGGSVELVRREPLNSWGVTALCVHPHTFISPITRACNSPLDLFFERFVFRYIHKGNSQLFSLFKDNSLYLLSDNEMHDAFQNNAFGYVTPVDSRHIMPFASTVVVVVFKQARVHVISILVLVICRATPLLRLMTDPIKLWPLPGILCSLWMPLDGYTGADATNKKIWPFN